MNSSEHKARERARLFFDGRRVGDLRPGGGRYDLNNEESFQRCIDENWKTFIPGGEYDRIGA